MLLQFFNLGKTLSFRHICGHLVVTSRLGVFFANLENVFQAFQCNRDNLGVIDTQQITERTDATLLHQELDLRWVSATRRVANSPGGFLANIKLSVGQQLNERWNNVVLNHSLNLVLVSSSDVRDGPARFLANTLLRITQKSKKTWEGIGIDNKLRLQVVTGNNVSNRSQGWGLDSWRWIEEELHQSSGDTRFQDGLNLFVRTIREVRKCPASISQDFFIRTENQLRQGRQGRSDHLKVRLWLSTAEIRKRPGSIAQHAELGILMQLLKQWCHSSCLKDQVTTWWRISGNVTQSPHGLFSDIVIGREQEAYKDRDRTHFHNNLGVFAGSRSNICKSPRGFKLQCWVVISTQKLNEPRHNTSINHLLDRRILLNTKKATKLSSAFHLHLWIISHDAIDHVRKLLQLGGSRTRHRCWNSRGLPRVVHHAGICTVATCHEHTSSRHTGRSDGRWCRRGHLTALGQSVFLLRLSDLKSCFFATTAAFFGIHRLFEAF
mmetsp:Transcript_2250/g.3525  ORF Transcript_2250/g.3525 Transcript_2250/m.3525 type:complete len:493 (-) Transcript_2250:130-1608(-)